MFKPTLFDVPTTPRLINLLEDVRKGAILIPDFQRPFVWDDDRRLQLFDSISRGIPIGSFLLWRTSTCILKTYGHLGPYKLPAPAQAGSDRRYLLDGHQRLTTLYAALNGYEEDRLPENQVDAGQRRPIYYDLEPKDPTEGKEASRFVFAGPNKDLPDTHLPLSILFSGRKLWEFTENLRKQGKHDAADLCNDLAGIFKDYAIPLVPLVTEDINLVTQCFVRVNSQGASMKESHMLRALAATSQKIPLDEQLTALKSELAEHGHWGGLDEQILVNALKIHFNVMIYGDTLKLHDQLEAEGYEKVLDEFGSSLKIAVQVLADLGIRGVNALPYQYHLIAIIDAAYHCSLESMKAKRDELRRWLYGTAYTAYFVGRPSIIRKCGIHVRRIIQENIDPIPGDMTREVFAQGRYDFKATRSKAFVMFLIEKIEPDQLRRETEDYLAREGPGAIQRILPRTSGDTEGKPANRVVAIPDELRKLREMICNPKHPDAHTYYERYLIPHEAALEFAAQGEARGSEEFLRIRGDYLLKKESEFIKSIGMSPRF